MEAHSSPAAPAFSHMARSMMPSACQRSSCGANSAAKNRRACSSSRTRSSVIQAGRGRLRMSMTYALALKCLCRQFHRAGGAGLDALELRGGLRQQPLHEEAAGDKLGIETIVGCAGGELLARGLDHLRPHVAERNQT